MKKIAIMALAMTVAAAYTASAQTWTWIGGTEETNWTDASAWSVTQAPEDTTDYGDYPGHKETLGLKEAFSGKSGNIVINISIPNALADYQNLPAGVETFLLTINAGGSITMREPWIGRNQGSGHIDVNGGSFTSTTWARLASGNTNPGSKGWLTVRNGGTATIGGDLELGRNVEHTGIVTIEDGTVRVNGANIRRIDTTPELEAPNLYVTLNHTGALLEWTGNKVSNMDTLIASQLLRKPEGWSWVDRDGGVVTGGVFYADTNYTELRVIPEPGTIALLGLAGLALFVRRRFVK